MTKKILMLMMAMIACALMANDDRVFTCSTQGTDRYADGTAVKDGECYALVYTEKGCTFQGFNADGTAQNPEQSYVALAAPLAKDHRCPPTLFQVLGRNAASRTNGTWEVFLLDTRTRDGLPSGLDADGRIRRVNAWSRVRGRIRSKKGGVSSFEKYEDIAEDDSADRIEGGASAVPPNAPKPRITGIRVVDGKVKLTVADTVPYLTYGVEGAHEPHHFNPRCRRARRIGQPQDGCASKTITMEVDANAAAEGGSARFYKIVRE